MDELRLCLVTDRHQTSGRDLVDVVRQCVAAGLPSLQIREKDLSALDLAALCRRVLALGERRRPLVVVNDRVDVALAVGADGVQRTHASLALSDIAAIAKNRLLVGASSHSLEDSIEAEKGGADWITFGPVYDTPSKRIYGTPQGLAALERVAHAVRVPVIAIGGITPERVREVRAAGARGVAVISAILTAASPALATRRFLEALDLA